MRGVVRLVAAVTLFASMLRPGVPIVGAEKGAEARGTQASEQLSATGGPPFTVPTYGFVGLTYGQGGHAGLDIWTGDPRAVEPRLKYRPPCGNQVRVVCDGVIRGVYKSITNDGKNWRQADRGEESASIVVVAHRNVPGAPSNPIFTMYMHMAKDDGYGRGAGTCISNAVWDNIGRAVSKGFVLGYQGDLRLAGPRITHLHFSASISATKEVAVDPSPFLGLNVRYGTSGALRYGADALLHSGRAIRGTITTGEYETVRFFSGQGNLATIAMNKLSSTESLNPYLLLYAPNGSLINNPTADDDRGGGSNALIDHITLPQTGYYKIIAQSRGKTGTGQYSLGLSLSANTGPGVLKVIEPLSLSSTSAAVGQSISARFKVSNVGGQALLVQELAAGARRGNDWNGEWADFPHVANITLQPGQAYIYQQSRSFSNAGSYFAEPVVKIGGTWGGIQSANRVYFTVGSTSRPEVVIDELGAGFSKGGSYWQDDWTRGYSGHMFWTCVNGNVVDCWGEWRPNLAGGTYEVYAYIPDLHTNTTNARYEIHHANGVTIASRAQQPYSNVWVSLGTYSFNGGTSGYIRLSDATGETPSCATQIGFDAVKWVPR